MDTIDISQHKPVLCELARRYELPLSEVIDRIIARGIKREGELFDWSPSPYLKAPEVPNEMIVPSA